MDGKITYHQQVSYCGKSRCRKCREGIGHGPYWYAYQTINGKTLRSYIGKKLPPEVQASLETVIPTDGTSSSSRIDFSEAALRVFTLGQFRLERRTNEQWQTVTDSTWQRLSRVRIL